LYFGCKEDWVGLGRDADEKKTSKSQSFLDFCTLFAMGLQGVAAFYSALADLLFP
jgi:hypothetical protein